MKRICVFLMSFVLFALYIVPAFADTVTVNLDTATVEELQAARDAIDARLAEIRASVLPAVGVKFAFTGKGTQLLEGVDLCYSPARLFAKSSEEIKVTLCSDDSNRTYDGHSSDYQFAYVIEEQQSISAIIVETHGEWTLELSPIESTEQIAANGSGSCITGYFHASPPQIVSITFNDGWYGGYTDIYLYKIHANNSVSYDEWMWQDIVFDDTFDYVIKPESNVKAYFIRICCPHDTQWEIKTK